MSKPLDGIRVVGLEQAVAGPMCTRQLLDLGAEVVKVERPRTGDFSRQYNGDVLGYSSYSVWLDRGKRSIAVDLKSAEGQQVLTDLCLSADVVVSNFSAGALSRVLDDDLLERSAPSLVRCYITGYGKSGPYAKRKAYDLLIQGEAGITWSTGTESQRAKSGVSLVDLAGGASAARLVLAGIVEMLRTKRGRRFDVSLFDVALDWMAPVLLAEQFAGGAPEPQGLRHAGLVPYGAFSTGDGGLVNIAVQNHRQWIALCESVLLRDDISCDPLWSTNDLRLSDRDAVEGEIQSILDKLTTDELVARLEDADLPWGIINTPGEVLHHEQLAAAHTMGEVRLPNGETVEWPNLTEGGGDEAIGAEARSVPAVGQDTTAVLEELGYSPDRIADLFATTAVWSAPAGDENREDAR